MWILQIRPSFFNSHTGRVRVCAWVSVCVVLNMSHFLPHTLLWITPSSREYGLSPTPLFPPSSMPFPPCVLMRGPGKFLEQGAGGWLDWCPGVWVWVPLPLGRKWCEKLCIVPTSFKHFFNNFCRCSLWYWPLMVCILLPLDVCVYASTPVRGFGDCWNNVCPFFFFFYQIGYISESRAVRSPCNQ